MFMAYACHLTRFVDTTSFQGPVTSAALIPILQKYFVRWGCSEEISTDRGTNFTSGDMVAFHHRWGVHLSVICPFPFPVCAEVRVLKRQGQAPTFHRHHTSKTPPLTGALPSGQDTATHLPMASREEAGPATTLTLLASEWGSEDWTLLPISRSHPNGREAPLPPTAQLCHGRREASPQPIPPALPREKGGVTTAHCLASSQVGRRGVTICNGGRHL